MSPDHDEPIDEHDPYDEEPPRSIFAATWFRAVLVLIVLGVIGAVAVPYVMEWMSPPPKPAPVAKAPVPGVPAAPPRAPSVAPQPAPAEKKDSTMVPAPPPMPQTAKADPTKEAAAPKGAAKPAETQLAASAKTETKAKAPPTGAAKEVDAPKAETKKETAAMKPAETRRAAAKSATAGAPRASAATASGSYWVQVGAFRDPEAAKRLAAKLREQNYAVEESTTAPGETAPTPRAASAPADTSPAPAGTDRYDVFITGMAIAEIDRRLTAKGLAGEVSGTGVVIRPSLPLREAVALSKDLAVEGLKVQVRRAGMSAAAPKASVPAPAKATETATGEALHRVRVGSFPTRATAMATLKALEGKGYKGFIARGTGER